MASTQYEQTIRMKKPLLASKLKQRDGVDGLAGLAEQVVATGEFCSLQGREPKRREISQKKKQERSKHECQQGN